MTNMASEIEGMESGIPRSHPDVDNLISILPRDDRWVPLVQYQGFWLFDQWLSGRVAAQLHMAARDDDILVAALPKSGMTWLKSLVFAVARRGIHNPRDPEHPLRCANPHDCVEFLEEYFTLKRAADLEALPSPRILSTHTPYSLLAVPIRESVCRVVYICRDPKDNLISYWHFRELMGIHNKVLQAITLEQAVDLFCSGIYPCGPYWKNVLEFWNESLKRPDKVFFLRYEDLKKDPAGNVKKLAVFLGQPFSAEEERDGALQDILELCSFRSLKQMEVNQNGNVTTMKSLDLPRSSFFRKGEVGDWANHLTREMGERMDKIIGNELQSSGLEL